LARPTARASLCVPPAPESVPSVISGCPKRVLGRHDDIAHLDQLAASADGIALDCCDERFRASCKTFATTGKILGQSLQQRNVHHLCNVGASAENRHARQQDNFDVGVCLKRIQCRR